MVCVAPKMDIKKTCFKIDRTVWSKYNNHSRFDNEHNWGGVYDYIMSTRIFTLTINERFIWALQITRKVATTSISSC